MINTYNLRETTLEIDSNAPAGTIIGDYKLVEQGLLCWCGSAHWGTIINNFDDDELTPYCHDSISGWGVVLEDKSGEKIKLVATNF